jgi:hypothetical protein
VPPRSPLRRAPLLLAFLLPLLFATALPPPGALAPFFRLPLGAMMLNANFNLQRLLTENPLSKP